MTYAAELDDRRQEVRRGYAANVIRCWPKAAGAGNVAVTAPSATILDPDGESLGAASVTNTTVGAVSRLDLTIDATSYELRENYAAVITWTYGGLAHVTTLRFDSVLEPWDGSDVSLNDLVDEVADIGELLTGQIAAKGDTGRTIEQEASLLGVRACTDVKGWIRSQIEAKGRIYPRLILQRDELRAVVAAQAIARAYRAQGGGADSPARQLYQDWTGEAQSRLRALGELDYDADEDRVADAQIGGWGVVRLGRSWT